MVVGAVVEIFGVILMKCALAANKNNSEMMQKKNNNNNNVKLFPFICSWCYTN